MSRPLMKVQLLNLYKHVIKEFEMGEPMDVWPALTMLVKALHHERIDDQEVRYIRLNEWLIEFPDEEDYD